MSNQKTHFYAFDDNDLLEDVFSDIDDELEKKLWEIFDREKNRRYTSLI